MPQVRPVERVVAVDAVRLSTRSWDADGPSVLLVHGLASTSRIWDLVAPTLARAGHRVVAYDQRGHGRSTKPTSGYGFERTAGDAVALARAMRLGRVVAVGHSWGANVVLETAVRHPRSARSLVLVDGGFLNLRDRFDWPTARRDLAPPDLTGMPLEDFLARMRRLLGSTIDVTPEVEAVATSLVRVDGNGRIRQRLSRANHLRILRALWEQDALALLRRVRVPTLVIAARAPQGSPDSAGFLEEKRRAADAVRAIGGPVTFSWIDAIHDVPLHRPDVLARRILSHAARS